MQIDITEIALETLKQLLAKDKDKQAVYIYLAGIGCGGGGEASFSLTPVNQKDNENVLEVEGITFIYDCLILFHTKHILIDYTHSAYDQEIRIESFKIQSSSVR